MTALSAENLRKMLSYDSETGIFTWVSSKGPRKAGTVAGTLNQDRVFICINRKNYAAHRLAWLYVFGVMPEADIDHLNGDPSDNRISNLRDVPHGVNLENQRRPQKHGSSGKLGVCLKSDGRITASISVSGVHIHLGSFKDVESAHQRYLEAKRELHKGNLL